ncbi:MAG TPA: hypothetical protein VGB20_00005, partial [bacterium]
VASLRGDLTAFECRHWLEVEQLCRPGSAETAASLPGGIRFIRHRDEIRVEPGSPRGTESERHDDTA